MATPRETTPPTTQVVPANRFVGVVQVDCLEARVTSVACSSAGDIVLLTMSGPRPVVSAIAATLHKGSKSARKPAHFKPASGEQWAGPDRLYRMEGLGSGWLTSPAEPTTQLDVAILAQGANIGYCLQNPIPQPQQTQRDLRRKQRPVPRVPLPALRFVLASERADHPDFLTFTGLMRTLWLPFPVTLAPLMWNTGLRTPLELAEDESTQLEGQHYLIEPVEYTLGIVAWQIIPAKQWYPLLERASRQATDLGL